MPATIALRSFLTLTLIWVRCETVTETSTTTDTETATTSASDTSTTSQTSTTLPGPFSVTQTVVFRSNGTQEEVEFLVLGALGLFLEEASQKLYGEVTGLSLQDAVLYEFVHDGHCAAGWINASTLQDDVEACFLQCQGYEQCGFFAFDTTSKACAMYTDAGGCPDDSQFPSYNAYRLIRDVCNDGLALVPLMPGECPPNANLWNCEGAAPGSLCEADVGECGSNDQLNNCDTYDVYRKEQLSCEHNAGCPLRHRCSADAGLCVPDLSYGGLVAAATMEFELRSASGEAISSFLEDFREELPEAPVRTPLRNYGNNRDQLVNNRKYFDIDDPYCWDYLLRSLRRGDGLDFECDRRLTTSSPAATWRISVRLDASDRFSSEQVSLALNGLTNEMSVERAAFSDAVRDLAANQSLLFDGFLFSRPRVWGPTETATTATWTSSTATTATTSSVSSQAATTLTTATTFTTLAVVGDPAAPVESSTALIVAVVGGALALLAGVSAVAVVALKRRVAGGSVQHNNEPEGNEPDVERATATTTSRCSGNTIEI